MPILRRRTLFFLGFLLALAGMARSADRHSSDDDKWSRNSLNVSSSRSDISAQPGKSSIARDTSIYLLNHSPTSHLWSSLMGDNASLFHHRVESETTPDPTSIVLGVERMFGDSLSLQAVFTSIKGNPSDLRLLREHATNRMGDFHLGVTYTPGNGFFFRADTAFCRAFTITESRDYERFSIAAPHRGEGNGTSLNASMTTGWGFSPLRNMTIVSMVGLSAQRRSNTFRDDSAAGGTRLSYHTRETTLMAPADIVVRHVLPLNEGSRLLLQASGGVLFNFTPDNCRSAISVTGSDGFQHRFTERFVQARRIWNLRAAIGYQNERVNAWLQYDYQVERDNAAHQWTATLGWSF